MQVSLPGCLEVRTVRTEVGGDKQRTWCSKSQITVSEFQQLEDDIWACRETRAWEALRWSHAILKEKQTNKTVCWSPTYTVRKNTQVFWSSLQRLPLAEERQGLCVSGRVGLNVTKWSHLSKGLRLAQEGLPTWILFPILMGNWEEMGLNFYLPALLLLTWVYNSHILEPKTSTAVQIMGWSVKQLCAESSGIPDC